MTPAARIYSIQPQPIGDAVGCDALDGAAAPSVILPLGAGEPLAIWREENPLRSLPPLPPQAPSAVLALWSGWIPSDDDPAKPSIHTWTGRGWTALTELCERLRPRLLDAGRTVLFRPAASHVLSDPRSCVTFLNDHAPPCFALLLDPVAMLRPAMLPDASDHLDRVLGTLLHRPETRAVVLTDAAPAGDHLAPCPLGRGRVPPELIRRIAAAARERDLPIVLEGDPEPQLPALARA